MIPQLSFRSNVAAEARRLGHEIRELPSIAAKALTQTAYQVQRELRQEIERVFDRPTPYTSRSLFVKPATKQSLSALVWFKDISVLRQEHYLEPQVYGGERPLKRFEERMRRAGVLPDGMFAVPGAGVRLNRYGNMSAGQIVQVLSQLRTFTETVGTDHNVHPTGSARSRRNVRRAGTFFVVRPGHPTLLPGVYQRRGKARDILPILIFVKGPRYSARFKFFEIAGRVASKTFPLQFARGVADARGRSWSWT